MQKHQREIADYLRETYGAANIHLTPGGKHHRLHFRYEDRDHFLIVSSSPSDWRAFNTMRKEVRQMLGQPPDLAPVKEPRTLESMMNQLKTSTASPVTAMQPSPPPFNPAFSVGAAFPAVEPQPAPPPARPAKTWSIKMSAYYQKADRPENGCAVWFVFPKDALAAFPDGGILITKLDDEHWQMTSGGDKHFSEYSGKTLRVSMFDHDMQAFGSTACEAVEANGEILIYLPRAERRTVSKVTVGKYRVKPQAVPAAQAIVTPVERHPMALVATEARMKAIIWEVKQIEAICPYRFVRQPDGRFVWEAPVIE